MFSLWAIVLAASSVQGCSVRRLLHVRPQLELPEFERRPAFVRALWGYA